MMCQRCRGLLVHETFGDLIGEIARLCPVTRCVNCGCIEDLVIRANRLRLQMTNQSASHRRVRYRRGMFVDMRKQSGRSSLREVVEPIQVH
jgi:hypothetical protein